MIPCVSDLVKYEMQRLGARLIACGRAQTPAGDDGGRVHISGEPDIAEEKKTRKKLSGVPMLGSGACLSGDQGQMQ